MAKKEEKKTLDEVLKELNKKYGNGSVINGNQREVYEDVISTGSLGLDIAIGIGGLPKNSGKIVEIYGWESSGKSTLAQTIIGNFQKEGVKCLLVDAEDSLDANYSTNLGISLKDLLVVQLDEYGGEGAYNKIEEIVSTGEIGLVVIDSYNALQPLSIVQGEVGESTLGKHARMLNQAVMKCNHLASRYGTLFIFLGQLREKIGVLYGSPETTQGGNALRFYSHLRLKVSRSTTMDNSVMEGDNKIGNKTTVKVEKNKLGPPFKSCSFNIIYSKGIDKVGEIIELADNFEIATKYGKSITYDGVKQDLQEFTEKLKNSKSFFEELKSKVIDKIKNTEIKPAEEVEI
jgi:recombination protein RecA